MVARRLNRGLQGVVLPWLQDDWPLDWSACFQREAALVVEVGFGNVLFLIEQARRTPDANFVGIELAWGWVQRLAARLDDIGFRHVRLIQGEAHMALQYLFASNSIREIVINFPDPWPRKRHHARRLIQPELITLLHDRLARDGTVTIVTDDYGYAEWTAGVLEGQADLQPCFPTTAVHELAGRPPTKYEQKARGANLPIYYFVWRKPSTSAPTTRSQRREAVPHMVLEGSQDLDQTVSTWAPCTWHEVRQGVEVSTTLLRLYREMTADSWLLELVVKEGKLCQQVGVTLVARSRGQVLIKLSPLGFPRPTWGVQRAVWHVAEMLLENDPSWRVSWMSMGARDEEAQDMAAKSRRRSGRKRPSNPAE
jgi:tRNA (guanine-N7-)-methyltransferase